MKPISPDRAGSPDKGLRKLVTELAETTPEDVAAVLDMLDAKSAAQVRALLAAYTNIDDVFDLKTDVSPVNTAGLSDWLATRVLGNPVEGVGNYHMTSHAAEALRQIAATLPRQPSPIGNPLSRSPARPVREAPSRPFRPFFLKGTSS